jgi:hypothetical protein
MLTLNPLEKLLDFLSELDRCKIHFKLARMRDEAIMVEIAVPGERWEVEFFGDGQVEVEVFKSPGVIGGEEELARLLREFAD